MSLFSQGSPLLPVSVIALVGLALLAVLLYGSWLLRQKHVPQRSVLLLGGLRAAMVGVLVLGLFQPVLSISRTATQTPSVIVLVDTSASMASPAAEAASGESRRIDEVRRILRDSPALKSATRQHTLHWFGFDNRAYPITQADLDQIEPRGEGTDLAAALKSAWQDVRLRDAARGVNTPPSRVLLVTDGRHRSPADVVAAANELGLMLDVLAPSRAAGQFAESTAEIALVQSARRVLIGSDTVFQVTIRPHGSQEQLTLIVEEDGQEIQRRELSDLKIGADQFVAITHRPKEAGLRRYQFRLQHGDAPVDVPYAVNVQATDNRHDVLLLEDTWRWEFKYLRRVLEDDPSFSFTAMLSREDNAFVQFGEPERRVRLGGFPQSRRELDGFDTIVLGDVRPATWPRGLARNLAAAVSEGGRSLIVIAGPHLGEWIDSPELTRLLPVELTTESGTPVSGPIDVRLTSEGEASSWFQLTARNEPVGKQRDINRDSHHVAEIGPDLSQFAEETGGDGAAGGRRTKERLWTVGRGGGTYRGTRPGGVCRHRYVVALADPRAAHGGRRHAACRVLATCLPGARADGVGVGKAASVSATGADAVSGGGPGSHRRGIIDVG